VEVRTGNIFTGRLVVDLIKDIDVTETGVGRVMVKDGIVRLWIDVEELTVDNILSHFATVFRLAEQIGPIPLPVLIDLGNLRMVRRDARQLVAQMLKPEYNKKLAAIYHNPAQRVAATFFLGFNKLDVPVILVRDRDEALRWLKGEVDEVVDWGGGGYGPESTRIQVVAGMLEEMISGNFAIEPETPRTMDELDALSIGLSMLAEEISGLLGERDATEQELRARVSDLEQLLADRVARAERDEPRNEAGDGE
jgi:hypothetical protein